jgi:ABC-type iron transport system FetAB permease component
VIRLLAGAALVALLLIGFLLVAAFTVRSAGAALAVLTVAIAALVGLKRLERRGRRGGDPDNRPD